MSGADYFVPTFLVKINNQRIEQELAADIIGITIEEKLDLPTLFTMILSDRELTWIDHADLDEGNEIKVELGYLNETVELFDGEITGLKANYSSQGPTTVTIRGYDRLHRLARDKKTRTFTDMQDKQIAQEIANEVSLQLDADETGEAAAYVLQNAQTNLEFLKERSRRLGFEFGVTGTSLVFKQPQDNQAESVVLEWGKSLIHFSADLSCIGQVSKVEVRGWDAENQTVIVGQAESDSQRSTMGGSQSGADIASDAFDENNLVINDNSIKSQSEADNMAGARFNELSLEYNQAEGSCQGNPDIKAGTILSIKAVGEKLSGKYYVAGTQHELSQEGYVTSFQLKRNSR